MMQTLIDFSKNINHIENNPESQDHFENNKKHFSNQCKTIYDAMMRGEKLTVRLGSFKYDIGDFRRRIKDLIDDYNVPVQSNWTKSGKRRYKQYYLNINSQCQQ